MSRETDLKLIRAGQRRFEQVYSRREWMEAFGKNYLYEDSMDNNVLEQALQQLFKDNKHLRDKIFTSSLETEEIMEILCADEAAYQICVHNRIYTMDINREYSYEEHVKLAEELDKNDKLPATFMVVAPGSWNNLDVWDDINRMRTLNTTQSRRRQQMHVCPLQLDIVERIINRYSNEGDMVLDPFGGLMTVPMTAVKMKRYGYGIELSCDYFRDGVGYLQEAENEIETPTLFDFMEA